MATILLFFFLQFFHWPTVNQRFPFSFLSLSATPPPCTCYIRMYFSSGEILFEEKRCARAFSLGLRSINNSAKIIWSPQLVQSLGLFLSIQSWLSPAGVNKHGRGVELSLMMVEEGTWLLCSKFLSVYFFFEELGEMIYSLRIVIRKSSFLYSSLAIWRRRYFKDGI